MSDSLTIALPFRQRPFYMGFLLGLVTLFICGVIAAFSAMTRETIMLRNMEDVQSQLVQVIPADSFDNNPSSEEIHTTIGQQPVHFFRARKHGAVTGIALFADTKGYSGLIHLLIGIDAKGVITGTRVISHTETPGLGDNIDLSKSNWILGFTGKTLHNPSEQGWHVKKDGGEFDSFTGATITPRAVVKGVHESLQLFQNNTAVFLDQPRG
jgi:electron transport complex protein RnfG